MASRSVDAEDQEKTVYWHASVHRRNVHFDNLNRLSDFVTLEDVFVV